VTQEPEGDEVEELAREIRKIIESNRIFLERVNDEDYEDEDEESEPGKEAEPEADDYEEL
jgi:uncharacterized protein YwgA